MEGMWLLFAFVISFIVAFATTPFVKSFAEKIGAMDMPGDARRIHNRAIPRLGGLAIFYGFIVSVLSFCEIDQGVRGLILGSLIIVILGIFDDVKSLSPKIKLLGQIAAALVVVLHGVRIDRLTMLNLIAPEGFLELGFFSIPFTVIWIVGVINAVNFIDGLDGLAVGISSIASMSIFCIALIVSEPNIALITAALAGACFGFLPYNFNPAKIFMGDTGAMFLGFILATVSIMGLFKGYAVISFVVPVLVLGLPLFDTGFTIIRRIANKKPVMGADRGHLHHQLMDMGLSQKKSVGILCMMSTVLGLSAVVLIGSGAVRAMVLVAAILLGLFFAARTMIFPENNDSEKGENEND